MYGNASGPTKAVCYREVSTIRGVCYKRFHCIKIMYFVGDHYVYAMHNGKGGKHHHYCQRYNKSK